VANKELVGTIFGVARKRLMGAFCGCVDNAEEEDAANQKAIALLRKSPYVDQ
jgi:hypothetical protein